MHDSSCSTGQPQIKSRSLGRGLCLLTAAAFASVLGTVAYFQSEPTRLASASYTAEVAARVASSGIVSVGEQVQATVALDQAMQKLTSIVGSVPALSRATAVVVGTSLVSMSPLGAGLMAPAVVYAATKVLIPDVVKFISL